MRLVWIFTGILGAFSTVFAQYPSSGGSPTGGSGYNTFNTGGGGSSGGPYGSSGGSQYGSSGGSQYGSSGGGPYGGGTGGNGYGQQNNYRPQQPNYGSYRPSYKPYEGTTQYNRVLDPCQCYGHGDPRYTTCDGRKLAIKGECKYTLAKPCNLQGDISLPYFEIYVKQEPCFYNGYCIKYIEIAILEKRIRLMNDGTVLMKNAGQPNLPAYAMPWMPKPLPLEINDGVNWLKVWKSEDDTLIMELDFGLFVYFGPGVHNKLFRWVEVVVPACYAYHICGICGNYNGEPDDDMTTSQGSAVDSIYDQFKAMEYYSDSWITPDFEQDMDHKCYGKCLSHTCGCIDENERHHPIGDRWYNDDCSATFLCVTDKWGRIYKKIKNALCLHPNVCKKVNGVTACYSKGPCLQVGTATCCGAN